jgi:hypothetical protein
MSDDIVNITSLSALRSMQYACGQTCKLLGKTVCFWDNGPDLLSSASILGQVQLLLYLWYHHSAT